jgi:3-deoxy-7-phosphoheptulonate synthase
MPKEIDIIAGPCAVQSLPQMKATVAWAKDNDIKIIRGCFRKPRTEPGGFVGLGVATAMPIVQEALSGTGLTHATEVIEVADVELIAELLKETPNLRMINWIGAKTGPSNMIGAIAQAIAKHMPPSTEMGVKNQMEKDKKAWVGRLKWALEELPKNRVSSWSRGFSPETEEQRNQEDLEMTMEVKDELGVTTTVDPSHIAGKSAANVIRVTRNIVRAHNILFDQTGKHLVDRFIFEVSPDPDGALSDKPQQLSLSLASGLIEEIRKTIKMEEVYA